MKALLWTQDPLLRDQLRAGFAASPEVEVVCAEGRRALRELEKGENSGRTPVDWIWLELGGERHAEILQEIRERNREAPLVILGEERQAKGLASLKEQWKIAGFLKLPLDPLDFFKTLGRLRSRRLSRGSRQK